MRLRVMTNILSNLFNIPPLVPAHFQENFNDITVRKKNVLKVGMQNVLKEVERLTYWVFFFAESA